MEPGDRIAVAVARLDCASQLDREDAWVALRPLGFAVVPYLHDAYAGFATWQGRTALVYHAARYARISGEAVALGRLALHDRSYMVRYRACGLLAYSLRRDCVDDLEQLAGTEKHDLVRESAQAAMRAIERQNHHLFVDHDGSGRSFWEVNPGDSRQCSSASSGGVGALLRKLFGGARDA